MEGTEAEYKALAKKYKLPDFNELDHRFEISTIEEGKFLLRNIKRKMSDKIGEYVDLLEELIQPDSNIVNMHEFKNFSEEENAEVIRLFRTLMKLNREGTVCEIDSDPECIAQFIISVNKKWGDIQKQILTYAKKLRDSWDKKLYIKEKKLEYFG